MRAAMLVIRRDARRDQYAPDAHLRWFHDPWRRAHVAMEYDRLPLLAKTRNVSPKHQKQQSQSFVSTQAPAREAHVYRLRAHRKR